MFWHHFIRFGCLFLATGPFIIPAAAQLRRDVDFTRDVRPILSDHCFRCHGPDEDSRQADLRLDQADGLFQVRDGEAAIRPGDAARSNVIRRVLSHDSDEIMPPVDSNKSLTREQKETLVRWVESGAKWEQHWSFVRPTQTAVPNPRDAEWCRNEIDHFVAVKQESRGLGHAPEAKPHTLVRRLYLDLIGLPPTPEEVDHWIEKIWGTNVDGVNRQANEAAYQDLVGHLLTSPHYGERWARKWLDLARYADTNGYEKDRDRSIWPYRDWVVNAINDGLPFDRFTIEQLAGDMLPNATVAQRVATGFHRNTMLNEEGGIDPLEFRYHAMTDRVATTGTTWLGLTLGCCQCHTHKYDPISHREYFQVMAFLNNADEPSLDLPDESVTKKWAENRAKANAMLEKLADKWPVEAEEDIPTTFVSGTGEANQSLEQRKDGVIVVKGANHDTATYVVDVEVPDGDFHGIKVTARTLGKRSGPGRSEHGNFVLNEFVVSAVTQENDTIDLPVSSASATAEQDGFPVARAFDGNDSTGWAIHTSRSVPKVASATFLLDTKPLSTVGNTPVRLRITMQQSYGKQHTMASFDLTAVRSLKDKATQIREQRRNTAFVAWRETERRHAVTWKHLVPQKATANVPLLTIQNDNSIFASGDTAKRDDYYIEFAASDSPITALRLEALPDERLPAGGPGSTYYEGTLGDFYLTEISASAADETFEIKSASETFAKNRYGNNPASAALAIDGDVQTGWAVHGRQAERHVAVFNFTNPVPSGRVLKVHMSFGRHFASSLGRFRFSATDATTLPDARIYSNEVASLLNRPFEQLSKDQQSILLESFLLQAPPLAREAEVIRNLRKQPAASSTLVLAERPDGHPRPTFRHHRGEYLQPKEQVHAALPGILATPDSGHPATRLEFARWLVSPKNPLTARVVVNRQWAAIFGTGIVKTVDDFGLQGEAPSHPQLLDWLAVALIEDDRWSIRNLHRRIVTSSTYRQSSTKNVEASVVDPNNRLLSYSPRYRLDAEVIRDQLLVAAGVFSSKRGGPPVRPPQPNGVTEVAYGNPKWNASAGEDRYRRSLYTFTKRTAPFAMFSTFDAPSGEACIARRNRSNSPLQALTLLNDVMLIDLSRQVGEQLATTAARGTMTLDQVLAELFRRVLVRPPTVDELRLLTKFHESQLILFSKAPSMAREFLGLSDAGPDDPTDDDTAEVAAFAATARAVFGLDETLNRE